MKRRILRGIADFIIFVGAMLIMSLARVAYDMNSIDHEYAPYITGAVAAITLLLYRAYNRWEILEEVKDGLIPKYKKVLSFDEIYERDCTGTEQPLRKEEKLMQTLQEAAAEKHKKTFSTQVDPGHGESKTLVQHLRGVPCCEEEPEDKLINDMYTAKELEEAELAKERRNIVDLGTQVQDQLLKELEEYKKSPKEQKKPEPVEYDDLPKPETRKAAFNHNLGANYIPR